ncbi:hypothetical protein S7S_09415 [Isoalcanivorax pacificus W11-5]|uniref:Uncharacterized protein n=1 Tax=Isoalcanivorax pacificus W11-5 TaxID=391936 RepID=A0A0B4XNF4_9GAMM|nr:hypothetical protein [Isoalcanivorax pacificus]AJD48295.1 hypothetical protein S7S_09415 [Isoalcanivorax pacificus W11-5]
MVIETACRGLLRLVLAALLLASLPQARAEPAPYAALEHALDGTTLGPLMGLLDTAALARDAGLAERPVPEALLRRFGSQRLQGHRLYEQPDSGQLLLRLDLAPQGLNWLTLAYHGQSPKPVRDWYDHALGASLSDLARSMVALADDRAGRAFLAALGDPGTALASFRALPAALRSADSARLLLSACAGNACHADALILLDQLAAESTEGLWQLDIAVLGRDWRRFDRVMAHLNNTLGPDPGLVWLSGNARLQRGDCAGALAQALPAAERWPGYLPLYPLITQCLVMSERFEDATVWFGHMETRFGLQLDWQALASDPVYMPFVNSPAFRHWRATR